MKSFIAALYSIMVLGIIIPLAILSTFIWLATSREVFRQLICAALDSVDRADAWANRR